MPVRQPTPLSKQHAILSETIARLNRRPRSLSLEAFSLEADVGVSWLGCFARSEIADPSFNKVMAVKEHLDKLGIQ